MNNRKICTEIMPFGKWDDTNGNCNWQALRAGNSICTTIYPNEIVVDVVRGDYTSKAGLDWQQSKFQLSNPDCMDKAKAFLLEVKEEFRGEEEKEE